MPRSKEQMALTRELVATTIRDIKDPGLIPGLNLLSDEDCDLAVRDFVSEAPRQLWVFAYGSLLWNPCWEISESFPAMVQGWHRAFSFRVRLFRGTVDQPGLMMALDRGGRCQGMIFKVANPVEQNLSKLFKRELVARPSPYEPRWLEAQTSHGRVRAIGFVVNRRHQLYVGKLTLDEVADTLSKAAGTRGSCAEYLYETVNELEKLGIHDRNLWHLQQLVANKIDARVNARS